MMRQPFSLTRRRFITTLSAVTAGLSLPRLLFANAEPEPRLIVIILRGALDGLAAVPPYADPDYVTLHRELAIAKPGRDGGALSLDDHFGLHPALAFMHERYLAKELLVFHAVSSPYRERSHFDGQNVLESGLTQPSGTADGWLNRTLMALPKARGERAVAISQNVPLILRGDAPVISKSPQLTPEMDEDLLARLADLYSKDDRLSARLSEAMDTEKMSLGAEDSQNQGSMAGLARQDRVSPVARMAATLLRSEGGPQVAVFEASGWDTHANQGGATGTLAGRLGGLDKALRALSEDLGPLWPRSALLVVTEFGRTAAVNGTRGTDHGTGSCAFLLGGAVRGGRVIADWPGLSRASLLDGRDLRPTLDLRSVFKGVLDEHLHVGAGTLGSRIFPDSVSARPLQGLIRS